MKNGLERQASARLSGHDMKIGRSLTIWLVVAVIPYVLLSALIHFGVKSAAGQWVLAEGVGFLWLAGPPVLLLIAPSDSWQVYVIGTTVVLLGAFLAIQFASKGIEAIVLFGGITAALWFGFGLLMYLAMV